MWIVVSMQRNDKKEEYLSQTFVNASPLTSFPRQTFLSSSGCLKYVDGTKKSFVQSLMLTYIPPASKHVFRENGMTPVQSHFEARPIFYTHCTAPS